MTVASHMVTPSEIHSSHVTQAADNHFKCRWDNKWQTNTNIQSVLYSSVSFSLIVTPTQIMSRSSCRLSSSNLDGKYNHLSQSQPVLTYSLYYLWYLRSPSNDRHRRPPQFKSGPRHRGTHNHYDFYLSGLRIQVFKFLLALTPS